MAGSSTGLIFGSAFKTLVPVAAPDDGLDQEKNVFKKPWEDSDAIFVVEETKFHVHRQLLGIASPAFKIMLKSEFLEKYREVPLPGKAKMFLSFLLIIYSKEEYQEINGRNVGSLLALADQYQVAKVTKECRKFLMSAKLNHKNSVQFMLLARTYSLEDVHTRCRNHLSSFDDLDTVRAVQNILFTQLEQYRACLKEVLPQLVGLMEFTTYLLAADKKEHPSLERCPKHYKSDEPNESSTFRLQNCPTCQEMFQGIHAVGTNYNYRRHYGQYGNDLHFDKKIVDVACKVIDLLGMW